MIVREGDSKGFGEFEDLGVEFCQMVEELDDTARGAGGFGSTGR